MKIQIHIRNQTKFLTGEILIIHNKKTNNITKYNKKRKQIKAKHTPSTSQTDYKAAGSKNYEEDLITFLIKLRFFDIVVNSRVSLRECSACRKQILCHYLIDIADKNTH